MKLLYLEEHYSCRNYMSDGITSFKHFYIKKGELISDIDSSLNYLFFIRKGEIKILSNEYQKVFKSGEVFFIPKSAETAGLILADADIVVHIFDRLINLCEQFALEKLEKSARNITYTFESQKILSPIYSFLESLVFYIEQKMLCKHMLEIKQTELFMLFRGFYTKEVCASLFYPIICGNMDFRTLVLNNYKTSKTVQELADACCLSLTTFNRRFKLFFGDSPYNWMLIQKSKHIQAKLRNPQIPICDIVEEYGFSSSGHFTSYCKTHFNMTPTQLRKKIIEDK
ncbi:helix-turn-helix transcriptional regulator [Massilibacteroides sp.]|uniref:helix-turn-helix domain-containing protein n=1 Tax=Massilibacteroides sp. TaxID=2034766 RepID=UPI00260F3140|nr:helix-turn-helix transcriptional regulator [Massilibacteroides sp.]MDD4516645.1 helix-turn-helix transcriptional regulator [Massilibacteroides sp.]